MLVYSITASVDGYVTDREGGLDWAQPDDAVLAEHLSQVGSLGGYVLGRRLHETMLVWENDPSLRETEAGSAFADVWVALPKVVLSRTLTEVEGSARLATGSLEEEVAAALASTDRDVQIGGPELAGAAFRLGLLDELRVFRYPAVLGGGTRHLPEVERAVPLELVEARPVGTVLFERYHVRRE